MKAELHAARIVPLALTLCAGMALAGCQEKKQTGSSHATAIGEVLPGSVSDAMLPVDTVRSQPPLAPKVEASGTKPDKVRGPGKPATADTAPDAGAAAPGEAAPDGAAPVADSPAGQ